METIDHPASLLQLGGFSKATERSILELRSLIAKSGDILGSLELDGAVDGVTKLATNMSDVLLSIDAGVFLPLPDASSQSDADSVSAASRSIHATLAQLITAATQASEEYATIAAGELHGNLRQLCVGVRTIAAEMGLQEDKHSIISATGELLSYSLKMLAELKTAVKLSDAGKQRRITALAGEISTSVLRVLSLLPGQRDLDQAVQFITMIRKQLASQHHEPLQSDSRSRQAYKQAADQLLSSCSQTMVSVQSSPEGLQASLLELQQHFVSLFSQSFQLLSTFESKLQRPLLIAVDDAVASLTKFLQACLLFILHARCITPS
jgi:hypothetical protein